MVQKKRFTSLSVALVSLVLMAAAFPRPGRACEKCQFHALLGDICTTVAAGGSGYTFCSDGPPCATNSTTCTVSSGPGGGGGVDCDDPANWDDPECQLVQQSAVAGTAHPVASSPAKPVQHARVSSPKMSSAAPPTTAEPSFFARPCTESR